MNSTTTGPQAGQPKNSRQQARPVSPPPWFRYPAHTQKQHIAVVGAGITAACTARQLALAGFKVSVIGWPDGTSQRLPGLLVRPYPERASSPSHHLYTQGCEAALSFYQGHTTAHFEMLDVLAEPDVLQGGVLQPAAAINTLMAHPRITWTPSTVTAMHPHASGWALTLTEQAEPVICDAVVMCTAKIIPAIRPYFDAALGQIAGQACRLALQELVARLGSAQSFPVNNSSLLGASYRTDSAELDFREAENLSLIQQAQTEFGPEHWQSPGPVLSSHTGVRAVSPDHLPLIGPCPNLQAWAQDYADLHHGRKAQSYPTAQLYEGLWLNLAHGSRAATLAPLAAQHLAAALQGAALPLSLDLIAAVHPGRFALRTLKRAPKNASRAASTPRPCLRD